LVLGEAKLYQNLGDFTRIGDFTWRVSDCEELVGVTHRRWWVGIMKIVAKVNGKDVLLGIYTLRFTTSENPF